ncbi:MAG: sensor histidine kinase [Alphaproteobacteria bacterium]|nr:MAG: sensor histidine kinase [Alphaproteobacteria bacterium]
MFIKNMNQKIFQKILKNYNEEPTDELRALKMSVLIFIQGILVGIVFAPIHYYAAGSLLLIYSILISFFGLMALLFIKRVKFSSQVRLLFIIFSNLLIFFNSKSIGLDAGIQYFFAPAISLPFLMFSSKQSKVCTLVAIVIPILLGALLYLTPSWHIVNYIPLSRDIITLYGFFSTMFSLLMVSFSVFHFHRMVEERDREIAEKNKQIAISEKFASLGLLINGVAHEINNPLSVIIGSTTRLKRDLKNGVISVDECILKVDKINKMTERISKIINTLNTQNHVDRHAAISQLRISGVIDEASSFFKKEMEVNEISLSLKCHVEVYAYARENDLLQVLISLFSNSIDAIKDRPHPRWINVTIEKDSSNIGIIFQDAGNGIKSPIAEKVFDPFFTTKNVGAGAGLGLYISQNLMDSMNGKIEYLPSENHTTFKLSFVTQEPS